MIIHSKHNEQRSYFTMKMRAPSYPLIAIDPYFSIWSAADHLTDNTTVHWTDKPNTIHSTATIDGMTYRIIGASL